MKITDYLKPSQIILSLKAADKPSVLEELVRVLLDRGEIAKDRETEVVAGLAEREELTSTGLCFGIALPHIKTSAVQKIQIVFGRSLKGIDFAALDGNPVHFFFLVLAPPEKTNEYLKVISLISALMKAESTRKRLFQAKSVEEIYSMVDQPV